MEIQQLRCFVTVADSGSFSKAAQMLHLSQPSLSQAVGRLEAEFNAQLFHRGSRGVTLTHDGEALIASARRVLKSVEDTQASVDALHGLTSGTLSVMSFGAFSTAAAAVLSEFCRQYPAVTLRVRQPGRAEDVLAMVVAGSVDIGFVQLREAPPNLAVYPLGVDRSVALMSADSVAGRDHGPITIPALARLPLIAHEPGSAARFNLENMFRASDLTFQIAAECDHHETSIELARGGVGVYLTTEGGLPGGALEGLTVRRLDPARKWPMAVVHREGTLSTAAAAFRELVRDHYRDGEADARALYQTFRPKPN
ncbi:MAG: LysR family transcriptional regulator [Gordonia sp.]|nr:LysR family transcriptional regulator [Gordonia sp. (in: high G+C Gram-positive bacteria)]